MFDHHKLSKAKPRANHKPNRAGQVKE